MRAQVVLLRGDRILLAEHRRSTDSYWVLPGGSVEAGESPEQAAVREVLEETGLHIRVERPLFVDEPRSGGPVTIKQPRHTYLGTVVGGRLHCAAGEVGNPGNGRLARVEWMPLDSPLYDAGTRDTLSLVRTRLGIR
ncbi:MAG: hypothetical protein NVS4B2_28520 [Chloroflexota bacterium]